MACEPIRRPQLLLVALVTIAALLWTPATGHAAERETLASAGMLARGSGYATGGSEPVRILQRRLRTLGVEPGPIDGLYGPLTEGAVERFQQGHGLAVDGIVGRQTKWSLFPQRKSPDPSMGSESAGELPHGKPVPAVVASRDGPAVENGVPPTENGVPPEVIAALAGLGALLLVVTLHRQGDTRLNFGLTCAALLGVLGIGAVAGALFATRAAPSDTHGATADSGVLVADAAARAAPAPHRHTALARHSEPQAAAAAATPVPAAPGSAPPAVAPAAPAPVAAAPAPVATAPVPAAVPPPHPPSRPVRRIRFEKLHELNIGGGIRADKPDLLEAREKPRVP